MGFLIWKDKQTVICQVAITFYIIFLFILASLTRDDRENEKTIFYATRDNKQVPKIPTNPEDYVSCYHKLLPVYVLKMDLDETNTTFLQDSLSKNKIIYETDVHANYFFNPTSLNYNRVCKIYFFYKKY